MIDRANFKRIQRRIKILAAEGKIATAQRIEARSDETPEEAVQPEGREPDGEADAPERCSEHSIHSSSGRG